MTEKSKTKKKNLSLVPTAPAAPETTADDLPPAANENGVNLVAAPIDLAQVVPSGFEQQKLRRDRFKDDELDGLAASIKKDGLLNPITVRPVTGDAFEIVCGERRWLASAKAGLRTILCFVRELTDEQAFDIQLQENLQRKDIHPLDEAVYYKYLVEEKKLPVRELTARFGKSEEYIANRLKLNDLSATAQLALQKNEIHLTHALELAKYPLAAQKDLFEFCFTNYGYQSQALLSVPKLREKIEEHYLLRLTKAPFSTKATNLRADGLACVKCPERTGANGVLFAEYKKADSCLNRQCWQNKINAHFQNERARVAAAEFDLTDPVEIQKQIKRVPLVSSEYIYRDDQRPQENFVGYDDFRQLKTRDECAAGEVGIYFNGSQFAKKVYLCRDPQCRTHNKQQIGAKATGKNEEKEREERLIRKEEIFDTRVGEPVRLKVLKQASAAFDAAQTVFTHERAQYYQLEILKRMWKLQCSESSETAEIIRQILGVSENSLSTSFWTCEKEIENLAPDERARLLFLLLEAHRGRLHDGGSWTSQKPIRAVADAFGIDYRRLDAEERLAQAPMKHKEPFRNYLAELEAGNPAARLPRMHSEKWDARKAEKEDKEK